MRQLWEGRGPPFRGCPEGPAPSPWQGGERRVREGSQTCCGESTGGRQTGLAQTGPLRSAVSVAWVTCQSSWTRGQRGATPADSRGPNGEGWKTHPVQRQSQALPDRAGPDLNSSLAWQTFLERFTFYLQNSIDLSSIGTTPSEFQRGETQGKEKALCLCSGVLSPLS